MKFFSNPFAKDVGGAAVRTYGAGYVADYIVAVLPADFQPFAKALIVTVVLGWSLYQKYRSRQKMLIAAASPHAMTEQKIDAIVSVGLAPPVSTPINMVPVPSANR